MKKTSRDIHPRNIPTNFEKNPNIGCRVRGVDGRTDRQTDRPTDRRRATAIGPVDLKITTSFSRNKICIFGYSGGGGGTLVAHKLSDWAHLASQLSSHPYQSTYKILKQSDKDFVSYRENNEVSADAAA